MNRKLHARLRNTRRKSAAFTLKEMLVVIAVLALLCSVAIPALARVKSQTTLAQCAANLGQLTLAFHIYGDENNDRIPPVSAGSWAWVLPSTVRSNFLMYGMQRQHFYCPANTNQNADALWNFSSNYSVIGYAMSLPGSGTVKTSDQNQILTPPPTDFSVFRLPPLPVHKRVLVADATLCAPAGNPTASQATTYNWTSITGGGPFPHRTSHMSTTMNAPLGGNVGMLDGHVEWRNFFFPMTNRVTTGPNFWW